MPIETLIKKPIQLRGLQNLREDLGLLARGILDPKSFVSAYSKVHNPVEVEVRDKYGNLKYQRYTKNLRTNDGIDWQARVMGGGHITSTIAAIGYMQTATANIAITAPTSTTAGTIVDTNTRTAATIALNQFLGCTLVYMDNTTPRCVHLVGNSAAGTNTITWYFDHWFDPGDPTTQASASAANKPYMVIQGGPGFYIGLSTNAGAQAVTDHVLGNVTSGASSEIGSGFSSAPAAQGLGRAYGGAATFWSHTASTNTYQLKKTFTATGSFTAVQQCGMFTADYCPGDAAADLTSAGKGGGVMAFENTFSSVNMANGDTLTLTWTVTY